MSLPALRALATATVLAIGGVLLVAAPASAGIIDGSLNNAHLADHSNILGVMLGSALNDSSNNNANTRSSGKSNNSIGGYDTASVREATPAASCKATVTAFDPDGAQGTTTVAVPAGEADTEILVPDQTPGTTWGLGDLDHFTTDLVCTDPDTGETVGLITFPADLTAR